MHRFKFNPDDLFVNRLKTYPEYNIFIYQERMHINRDTRISGSGGIVVYDINRNRLTGSDPNVQDPRVRAFLESDSTRPVFKSQLYQPLLKGPPTGEYNSISAYWNQISGPNILASYPAQSGTIFTKAYGFESPIERKLTQLETNFTSNYFDLENGNLVQGRVYDWPDHNVTASALNNTARKYRVLSPHFIFSGSNAEENTYINEFLNGRNLVNDNNQINFIFIPSVYYGSTIKKGSVELDYYITGSKIASCADTKHNGTLIGTTGSTINQVVGLVMYDEGIIMLTSSVSLETGPSLSIEYVPSSAQLSSWLYYGTTLNDATASSNTLASASYDLNFKGTNYINSMTMFAHARKGHLNHSNTPTYRDLPFARSFTTGSGAIYQEGDSPIANVVSASYVSASFEKTTYISKIHIYDEDGNLIAITSMAKPVKKALEDEFTFKMKLDL